MRAALLILLVLVAGCSAPADPRAPASAPADARPVEALALERPEPTAPRQLAVELSLSAQWMKPFRGFDASVEAPPDARIAWFVEHDEVDARATIVDGGLFILKATTPDHHDTAGPRSRVEVLDLAPDGRARAMRLAFAGRYVYEGSGAQLVVNAWPGAPVGSPAQTFLVVRDGALRFEPAELDVAPGTAVLLWSEAPGTHEVRERRYAAHVPIDARVSRMTPIDEGLYRLTALAVQGDAARGVATAPFLVDFERPSDRLVVGPVAGRFLASETGAEREARLAFSAVHELRAFAVHVNASSPLVLPSSVEVTIERDGAVLVAASSLTAHTIELADLPAGDYAIVLRGEHGAYVGYEVSAEGIYRLPAPARLIEEMAK